MTADDDVFVHMPNLVGYLQENRQEKRSKTFGSAVCTGGPRRFETRIAKYYVPYEMYPWPTYPRLTSQGPGYVVSRDVAEREDLSGHSQTQATIYIDDVFMGICAPLHGRFPTGTFVLLRGKEKAPYHVCIYDQMMTSHGHIEDIMICEISNRPLVKQRTSGYGRKFAHFTEEGKSTLRDNVFRKRNEKGHFEAAQWAVEKDVDKDVFSFKENTSLI
ncbi:unnamed protein product [Boreogadus saida]